MKLALYLMGIWALVVALVLALLVATASPARSQEGEQPDEPAAETTSEPARAEPSSRGGLRPAGTFIVTNYSITGVMRDGEWTHPGAVAVDPLVIPLGTKLRIEGFSDIVFTAHDTGGGVRGAWIDVWRDSHWDAVEFGVQHLQVWIIP